MRVSPLAAELSRAERLPPRIVCGSKPLKTTMEVSDRRESERFPIMRCNRLRPWLLRILYPLAPLANRRKPYDSVPESAEIHEITSSC